MNPSNNISMKDTRDGVVVRADGRTLLAKLVFAGSARLAECDLGIDELRAAFKHAHGEEASKVQIGVSKPIRGKAAHSNLKIQKIERFLLTCSLSNRMWTSNLGVTDWSHFSHRARSPTSSTRTMKTPSSY